ncbi:MAG TPA: hypothetical protein VHL58_03645 [Thermoanaerobaculia bacterium]|nr:hypothetical protein [Thermoanaerobaculia bacterium]
MSRGVTIAWLAGSAAVSAAAFVLFFDCCVLPLHHQHHGEEPICAALASSLGGNHDDVHADAAHAAVPVSSTSHDDRLRFPRFASFAAAQSQSAEAMIFHRGLSASRKPLRSLISLGALRVDDDVGLLALLATFRI